MTRGAVAGLILSVWAGALGWLLTREMRHSPGLELDDAIRTVPPGATYYRVALGDAVIGFASNTVDTVPEGLQIDDRLVLEVPALGTVNRTDIRTVVHLTNRLRLTAFEATMGSAVGVFTARGRVDGDTVLVIGLATDQSTQTIRVPLEEPIVLPAYVPLRLAFGGELRVGNTYELSTFDPLLLAQRRVSITVAAESTIVVPDSAVFDSVSGIWAPARWDTLHAWQVEQRVGGVSVNAWIDDLGRVISAESGIGFGLDRTAFEIAFHNFQRRDRAQATAALRTSDIIRQTAIASNVNLSRDGIEALRVRLTGVDLEGFDLDGGRQRLRGDTLTVQREADSILEPQYSLPATNLRMFEPYVSPEPLIQSTDPRIAAQARQIIGRTRNPRRAAERLNTWVYEHLDKQITISVPNAVQVLETGRGDCNEHTILYVALARAVGLPTRTAAGLVYSGGSFYYHAWPEVHLGADWVAVDPTFGQFPADASHLRFTVGGLARQVELIRLIGRLGLDVLPTEE